MDHVWESVCGAVIVGGVGEGEGEVYRTWRGKGEVWKVWRIGPLLKPVDELQPGRNRNLQPT
jgi:hypothetical protein